MAWTLSCLRKRVKVLRISRGVRLTNGKKSGRTERGRQIKSKRRCRMIRVRCLSAWNHAVNLTLHPIVGKKDREAQEKAEQERLAKEEADRIAAEKKKKKPVRYPTEDLDIRISDKDKKAGV